MRLTALIALGSLLLGLSPAAAAPPPSATPAWLSGAGLTIDPEVRAGQLPNGMRYLLRRSATPPGVVSARLRIDTGSLNESDKQRGVAHLLEHLVLNGTKNVPEGEFMRRAERLGMRTGADTNATTDLQQTVYRLDLPRNDAATLDTALFLLREIADRATLDPAALDRERGVVLAEERSRATPSQQAGFQQLAWLFRDQRIADRAPIGTIASIQSVPRAEVLAFYQAWYRPENATLIIAGDVDPAALEQKIRTAFADWRGEGPAGVPADEGRPIARQLDQSVVANPEVPLGLTVNWLRPAKLADSRAARIDELREAIVGAIFNRRLARLSQQSGTAPFTAAVLRTNRVARSGQLTEIGIQARDGDWQRGLSAVNQEQRRLLRYGVTPGEIATIVTALRTAFQTQLRTRQTMPSPGLADLLLLQVNNRVVPLSAEAQLALFEEVVRNLQPEGLRADAERLFTGSGPLIYLTTPRPLAANRPQPSAVWAEAAALAITAPVEQAKVGWPYAPTGTPGQVVEKKQLAALGTTSVRFANGVRLLVRPNKARDDQVFVRVAFGTGRAGLDPTKPSAEWAFGSTLLGGGTKTLDRDDLQRAVADKITGLSFGTGENRFSIGGGTRTEDLPTELQLLAAYLREPGWRQSGFDQVRANAGRVIQASGSSPSGVLGRELSSLLASNDPRYRLPPLRTMLATTLPDVRRVLEPEIGRGAVEIVIGGDVDVDAAIRAVAETFGTFPQRPPLPAQAPDLRFPKPGPTPVPLLHRGRADQALVAIAWPTVGLFGDTRESRALSLLAAVYQQRMSDRLREEMGSTYVPLAQHSASRYQPGYGFMLAASEAPTDRLRDVAKAIREIAAGLGQGPITPDELERARQPLLLNFEREQTTNEYWLSTLSDLFSDPRVERIILTRSQDYRAVTAAELQAAARKYLLPATAYEVDVLGLPSVTPAAPTAPVATPVPPAPAAK